MTAFAGVIALCASVGSASAGPPTPWTSPAGVWAFTGGASHHPSLTRRPFPDVSVARWKRLNDDSGNYIRWIWQAAPVVTPDLVIALGFVSAPSQPPNRPKVFAISRDSGAIEWTRELPPISIQQFFQGSQSSLTLDTRNRTVVAVLATKVTAIDVDDGEVRWQTSLPRNIVNASPVMTDDLGRRNRLFITDYDAASGGGSLYCINVDSACASSNPYQPGEVVWTVPMSGASGNTPAYLPRRMGGDGSVYVASAGHYGQAPGSISAFPAGTDTAPAALWTTVNILPSGFFGGVTIVPVGMSGRRELLAASYEFFGGLFSADMLRIEAATGTVLGAAMVNRSSAIPVMLPGGLIAITGGLESAFGLGDTVPSVSMYDTSLLDPPATPTVGSMLWNSAVSTWVDLDFDGIIDSGEYFNIGGYTHQPLVSLWKGRALMATGEFAPGDNPGASDLLAIIDLQAGPSNPSFVHQLTAGAGGSPALAGPNLYSVGLQGLCAFGPEPARFDIDADYAISPGDMARWERGQGPRDINDDGAVTIADRDALTVLLRASEVSDMLEGRP